MRKRPGFRIAVLLTAVLMGLACRFPAAAAQNPSVTFEGRAERFLMQPGEDLFQSFKGLLPGSRAEQVIELKNTSKEVVRFSLRALPADDAVYESVRQKELSRELLSRLTLLVCVRPSGEQALPVYRGPLSGEGGMEQPVSLGTFQPGGHAQILVYLTVPEELDNRYQDAVSQVNWIFSCGITDETPEPEGPDINPPPVVDIPDDEIPLGPPPLVDIPDDDIPLFGGKLPVTGDELFCLLLAAFGGSCVLFLLCFFMGRRGKHTLSQ